MICTKCITQRCAPIINIYIINVHNMRIYIYTISPDFMQEKNIRTIMYRIYRAVTIAYGHYLLYLHLISLCPYATVSVVFDNKNLLSS